MELSILCNQDIQIVIYDKQKNRMVVYQNDPNFTSKKICKILNGEDSPLKSAQYEEFHNGNYDSVCE